MTITNTGRRMSDANNSKTKATNNTGSLQKERRKKNIPVAFDRRGGKDQQPDSGRRRLIDPTTCEREYTDDEIEFMRAIDQYKRDNRRRFPTCSEVLEVLCSLGYRKVAEPSTMPGLQPSGDSPS